jgi:hypothetical protein
MPTGELFHVRVCSWSINEHYRQQQPQAIEWWRCPLSLNRPWGERLYKEIFVVLRGNIEVIVGGTTQLVACDNILVPQLTPSSGTKLTTTRLLLPQLTLGTSSGTKLTTTRLWPTSTSTDIQWD